MIKIVCESLQEYRLFEASGDTDVSPESTKNAHPAKTLKTMLNMPYDQFIATLKNAANDPKIDRVMSLGRKDGIPTDEIIKVTAGNYLVAKLRPTQSQIGLGDSLAWLRDNDPTGQTATNLINGDTSGFNNARILIANGKYIIDGHHRWSQVFMFNPKDSIPAINLEIPGFTDPKQLLKIVQMAIASTYKNIPSSAASSDTDIFNDSVMSEEQIRKALPGLMGRPMIDACKAAYGKMLHKQLTDEDVNNIMTSHAMMIKKYKPVNAPPRSEMPQPSDAAKAVGKDKAGVQGIPTDFVQKLKSGQLNFKAPLIANQPVKNQNSMQNSTQTA